MCKNRTSLTIHLEGLSQNLSIVREQVNVQPNFAMTMHAAQGKNRLQNPVNLVRCKNHLAIYIQPYPEPLLLMAH